MIFVFESVKDYHYLNFTNCTEQLKTGFNRFTVCPITTTMMRFKGVESPTYRAFGQDIIETNTPPSAGNYVISSGVAHSPIYWCGVDHLGVGANPSFPERQTLFSFLEGQYLEDLQSGRAFLLLDQSHEGYQTEWLWSWFHNNCDHYNINPRQIIYATGNLLCADQYNAWSDVHGLVNRMLVLPYPHFELMIYDTAVNQNNGIVPEYVGRNKLPTFESQLKYKDSKLTAIKTFNALQKRPRGHRMWFFKYLYDANLLNSNFVSMNTFTRNNSYFEGRTLTEEEYAKLEPLTPMLPPELPTNSNTGAFQSMSGDGYLGFFNEQTMLDSWLTVVSEASFGESDHTCFISEKTFKPIACYHPFIIFGNKGSLQKLKEMGYKTFHPYINETYDTLDTWERMQAITDELVRIDSLSPEAKLEWYYNMKDILVHNYNNFHKNSYEIVPPAMTAVKEYVKD
jgi:hypothetical protein